LLDYVYGQDQIVANFVASLIPAIRDRGFGPNIAAFGVLEPDGKLIAGMVYHNWDVDAGVIEMSGAALPGKQWLTRETIRHMYRYPFLGIGCQMVLMRVSDQDQRLLRQLAALNYAFTRIPRLLGRDHDAIICTLTREAWDSGKIHQRLRQQLSAYEEAA
jgi:hypothetical protein